MREPTTIVLCDLVPLLDGVPGRQCGGGILRAPSSTEATAMTATARTHTRLHKAFISNSFGRLP
jgi:hypothetical protein